MSSQYALSKRALSLLGVGVMTLASLLPMLMNNQADAAQLSTRSITPATSVVSISNTYTVSFNAGTAASILGLVVDFCDSPLVGAACDDPAGMVTPNTGTITVSDNTGTTGAVAFTATGTATGRLLLNHVTGLTSVASGDNISFSFTATNPSALGTYYARIVTTSTQAAATGYSPTNGTATAGYIDYGGIALSTARQLTVNARVQEQLEFCVSAIDGTIDTNGEMPANCAAMPSVTEVNIGVIDNTAPIAGSKGLSPVPASNGGNDKNGGVMVRTNASGGAVLTYRAEQETSAGKLKVVGATCTDNTSAVDQCINSAGAALASFTAVGERFGMAISDTLELTSGGTNNLAPAAAYNNPGANVTTGFAWVDSGVATTFATTTNTVSDYEMAVLRFAARAAATTPTGAYTVTSTYIATATF